ncbi:hypothetical protein SAMN03097694_2402 [Janthinobacterium lividum]|uniref:Uncharacterized protein n=1 Tax=Janthinobacterium lividum TaxID=29581 RepID=A0AB38C7L2_9BURK|nr:hypothetical protein [Janthinobacterium lividum]SFX48066.1 hypothetical protein SAMN03097694_2402 [Janthinobacterium lividum]
MVTEEDAWELLEEIRQIVCERGFERFDAHATALIMTSADSEEPIRTIEHALSVYSKVVSQLLRSVGAKRIRQAKKDIAEALELDDITLELDLTGGGPMLPEDREVNDELEGIDDADQLADELEEFNRAVYNFSYPDPEPTNGGPSL